MKTVAVVSPDFTPSSMPNALRVRLLVEHLQEYGWEPVVIATDPQYYELPADPENESLLRGKYEIIRTRAWPARFTRRFGLGDVGLRSFYYQWRALSRLCRSRKVDLVFISVPPNYSMALGRLANLRFAVPYVIDYQDPYITDYYKTVPPAQRPPKWRLAYAVAHLVEPFSVRRAAHLVSVDTSYLTGVLQRYKGFAAEDATGVQLGVEPSDFDYIRQHPRENPIFDKSDGLLHISYVGRGGPDMLAAAGALFAAVKLGGREAPEIFDRIRLHFVGTDYARADAARHQLLPLARQMGMGEQVHEHPCRVPYLTALQILLDSHALVVVGSTESHYTPSKIFPYILAKKPLLGIFNENSSVVGILRDAGAGEVVTFSAKAPPQTRVREIYQRLHGLLTCTGQPREVCWDAFEPYTARALTARLVTAFEKALAHSSADR
jgi:hypothetical protein